jgi:CheY-like chemotaxis protein
MEYQVVNLNNIILNFQDLLRRTIREDIKFHLNLAQNLINIKADVGQIEQVLMNLSVNAQDAMPEGGILLFETELVEQKNGIDDSLQEISPGNYVVMTISDTGTGMDKETEKLIFEPFFSTKGEHGTGLGLATVFGIISQHGGGIRILTNPGKGSSFKIYLPVDLEGMVIKNKSIKVDKLPSVNATILLVEDNDQVRNLAYDILSRGGYKILTASNGIDALSIIKDEKSNIDLLLSDVIMPGMNGRELLDHALKILPDLKIVFMSGYTDDTILIHGLSNESFSLLQKPFTINSLTSKVYEALIK